MVRPRGSESLDKEARDEVKAIGGSLLNKRGI